MKSFTTILFAILTTATFGQTIFTVDNFSKDYYGKIQISDTSEVFSEGWVAIYDRNKNKQIIKIASDELYLELHDGKALANIKSLPYGEQSLIMYEDFNFDGKKDFAICDGQNSCYHGPSFQIFLSTTKGFLYNKDFTRLAQEYCGMFQIDSEKKQIYTMTKSGCCWHEFSTFSVINNKPQAINVIVEDASTMPFYTTTEQVWNGKSMITKSVSKTIGLEQKDINEMLYFEVPANDKQVLLFLYNEILYYTVLKKDGSVEFSFPNEIDQSSDFRFTDTETDFALAFTNKNAAYTIREQQNKIEIIINVHGKTYKWIGDVKTKKGSLEKLRDAKIDNIIH
jgi:hypothetical protein